MTAKVKDSKNTKDSVKDSNLTINGFSPEFENELLMEHKKAKESNKNATNKVYKSFDEIYESAKSKTRQKKSHKYVPNAETLKAIKDTELLEARINKEFQGFKGVICEMDNGELKQYKSFAEVCEEIKAEIKEETSLNA